MASLIKASGPRDSSHMEVQMHISNLEFQYALELATYEDGSRNFFDRSEAYTKMERIIELIHSWREVARDIENINV